MDGGVAERVAEARKLAGLTQQQLAMRANLSLSLVKKVEQGTTPASPTFIAAAARALGLLVTDLTQQPHFASITSRYGTEQALIPDLERAIVEFEDPCIDGPVIDLDEAGRRLAAVIKAGRVGRYTDVLVVLPGLLRHLHASSWSATSVGAERERSHRLLAQTYQCAMFAAYKLGHLSLCAWAAERMNQAGLLSGDQLWSAMGLYARAQALMFTGSYRSSGAVLNRAALNLAGFTDARALEVRGAIHLTSAIVAARLDKREDSDLHLAEARGLAAHVSSTDHFDTAFSAANVDIHSVAAAVEMSDAATALQRGTGLQLRGKLYPSRRSHYHIDLARAFFLHGSYERSIQNLQMARQLAPQQTRYHPQVHETIRALARVRRRNDPVARLASWAGLRDNG
ncbi:MAG TPA: helix-turn-helix transcriptional regulator [Pseudonocardiaceae bacterium]|jgi:transcriptional regulator with XRE-family HTH domain|nr:helix-turn-helix transcriptional regulator [Pseudonocardiaceae bacterium]